MPTAAFWEEPEGRPFADDRGFETSLGFGIPLLGKATGPWLETRGQLAFRGTELVQDTRRRLDLNVSEELALEALSFRLAAVLG